MSDTKWTPGPWRLREHPVTDDCFVEADGGPDMPYKLDVCGDDYTGHGEDEARKANMRLIAAAPCMDRELGADYEFLLNLRDDSDDPVIRAKAQERINAIVDVREKARGQS